jgi:putative permease
MKGRNWVGTAFSIILVALILTFLILIGEIVKLLVISVLLAYIIDPVAVFMESRGMTRTSATVIIFSSFLLIITIFIFLFYPILFKEIETIQKGLDSGETGRMVATIEASLEDNFAFLGLKDLDLMSKMHNAMVSTGTWIFDHLLDVVSLITNLVIVPFIVFFLLKDGRQIIKQFVRIIPNRYFEFSLSLLYKMDVQLGNYFRGQFLDALIFGILSIFALWLLGVKYFLVIGIFAPHMKPLFAPVPIRQFTDRWKDDVCMQSTPSSCGAASAATIFRIFGQALDRKSVV